MSKTQASNMYLERLSTKLLDRMHEEAVHLYSMLNEEHASNEAEDELFANLNAINAVLLKRTDR